MLRPHYPEKFVFIIKISLVNGCAGCWHTSCHLIVQATELGWGISDNEVWSPQQTQITGHSCQAAVIFRSLQQIINTFNHFHSFIHSGCRDFRTKPSFHDQVLLKITILLGDKQTGRRQSEWDGGEEIFTASRDTH